MLWAYRKTYRRSCHLLVLHFSCAGVSSHHSVVVHFPTVV